MTAFAWTVIACICSAAIGGVIGWKIAAETYSIWVAQKMTDGEWIDTSGRLP